MKFDASRIQKLNKKWGFLFEFLENFWGLNLDFGISSEFTTDIFLHLGKTKLQESKPFKSYKARIFVSSSKLIFSMIP
jgi:hypothetical protein